MSFSSNVKAELSRIINKTRHCQIAEIAAIVNACGKISQEGGQIAIQTENAALARKFFILVKSAFSVNCEVSVRNNRQLKKKKIYIVEIYNESVVQKILIVTGLQNGEAKVDPILVMSGCCKRAYLRGAFLSGGSLTDPEKAYHMEFVCETEKLATDIKNTINSFEVLESKMILRKKHYVVYLKDGEMIVDLLNVMGAHLSLLNLENIRILKSMRNNVNRTVNCETANISKSVTAASKYIEAIELIDKTFGIENLPDQLYETANARIKFPEISLTELGESLVPPIGKSGVNHRLRKILKIASNIQH